jgi:hypothetical protein
VADALRESLEADHRARSFDPSKPEDLLDLAHSARTFGIVADVLQDLDKSENPMGSCSPVTDEMIASFIKRRISPHPARFEEFVKACQAVEAYRLKREVKKLEGCGEAWGRVIRLFHLDRKGRERMRTYGLHACKSRHCPRCGRGQQSRRTTEMEKVLILGSEWGLNERNIRFVTLTVPNGDHIPTLRKLAHEAFARLQRKRWWPRHVFGWFRGSECVTGEDGHWNFHLHIVVILWDPWMSYRHLWDQWGQAVGVRAYVDSGTLKHYRETAKGKGFLKAARYATKYLSKQEHLNKVKSGPGGFAHYVASMRRVRAFAVGGGASLLRRLIPILMSRWIPRAEWSLQNEVLNADGRPPCRVEEVNPETGEVFPLEAPHSPFVDSAEREGFLALARELYTVNGLMGTVGEPCGEGKRLRRLGATPLPSRAPTVASFEAMQKTGLRMFTKLAWVDDRPVPVRVAVQQSPKGRPLEGIRALIAGGCWKVERWTEFITDKRTGRKRPLPRACVLPAKRFAWRDLYPALVAAMLDERTPEMLKRKRAYQAWAENRVSPLDRRDAKGLLVEALKQAKAGARIEAYRINQELDQEQRKVVADPERAARLTAQREDLLRPPFAVKPREDPWATYDAEVLGIKR